MIWELECCHPFKQNRNSLRLPRNVTDRCIFGFTYNNNVLVRHIKTVWRFKHQVCGVVKLSYGGGYKVVASWHVVVTVKMHYLSSWCGECCEGFTFALCNLMLHSVDTYGLLQRGCGGISSTLNSIIIIIDWTFFNSIRST